jgi:DNA mismatch repair ATPase MutS
MKINNSLWIKIYFFKGSTWWCGIICRCNWILFTTWLVKFCRAFFKISFYCSLLSFSLIACEQNNYTRPELTVNNRIEIIDGKLVELKINLLKKILLKLFRHPLLPITTVVPNNYTSDASSNSANIHILTGFNCSGKTIYIKQVRKSRD